MIILRRLVFCLFATGFFALSDGFCGSEQSMKALRAEEAHHYTVRVSTVQTDVFDVKMSEGHGTGFIVSLSETQGLVFTCRHVIEKGAHEAREITLDVNTQTGLAEQVTAQVVFESLLYDFAVLKFNPRELKRARNYIRTAPLPTKKNFFELIRPGAEVMAYGNPLDGENLSHFGSISGHAFGRDWDLSQKPFWGSESFIMTEAAINGGHSGGPFVELQSGKVVGLNTASYDGANPQNFVTPILPLLIEWQSVKKKTRSTSDFYVPFSMQMISKDFIEIEKLRKTVEQRIPRFFEFYTAMPMVDDVPANSPLDTGDLILSVEDEPIGDNPEKLIWLLQQLEKKEGVAPSLRFEVLRQKKIVKVNVPVMDVAPDFRRRSDSFVMVAGLFVQDLTHRERFTMTAQKDGVIITRIIQPSAIADQMEILPGSVIVGVEIDGRRFPIRHLGEFRRAILSVPEGKYVRLELYAPHTTENGEVIAVGNNRPVLQSSKSIRLLPVVDRLTPKDFSLRDFRNKFNFSADGISLQNWRLFVRKEERCEKSLQRLLKGHLKRSEGRSQSKD